MVIKTLIFLLFSITAIQACTKDDLLHAQGKSPCLVKLSTSRVMTVHMQQQYQAYYNELKANKMDDFLKKMEKNHTKYANEISGLLKEYDDDIAQVKVLFDSEQRLKLCQKFINSVEKKHDYLESLGQSIKSEVVNAAANDQNSITSASQPPGFWENVEAKWHKIEKPLFTAIGIGVVVHLSWKIGKKVWNWGKSAYRWSTATEEGTFLTDDIEEFSSAIDELVVEEELGADAREFVSTYAEALQSNTGLLTAAEDAIANEASSTLEALEARTAAESAAEGPEAAELLEAARAAEVARATSSVEAAEAVQASELAEAVQVAKIAEAAEGLGEATVVEGVGEAAAEVGAESAGEAIAVGSGEAIAVGSGEAVAVGAGEAIAVGAGEAAAIGAGEAIAVGVGEGAAVAAAGAGSVAAAPFVIAGAGVLAVAGGLTYVIAPEATKKFFKDLKNSVANLFRYS